MPKIESIRPGDTLDATFASYPLAELLLGILRGNLTGRLNIFLHPEPRNYLYFRDGVPLVVRLPDAGGSIVQMLVEQGRLTQEQGLELMRKSDGSGRPPLDVLRASGRFAHAELHRTEVGYARSQLRKLFDVGPVEFRFVEGAVPSESDGVTILQPLPIVYAGLVGGRDRSLVQRFVATHADSRFSLGSTYPHHVDPFEWGESVEAVLMNSQTALSVAQLEGAGLGREHAIAMLAALFMTGMVDLQDQGRARVAEPAGMARAPSEPSSIGATSAGRKPRSEAERNVSRAPALVAAGSARPRAPSDGRSRDGQGLVIHRRGPSNASEDSAAPDLSLTLGRVEAHRPESSVVGGSDHDREYGVVRDRITPYFGQNYFQILRVTAGSDAAQLDRAYRFLVRRFEEEMERPGTRSVLDLVHEAYEAIKDEQDAHHYANLVERGDKLAPADRERRAFEAEPKVERAVIAMAEGRTGEATLLLSWAERLDPSRSDLEALFGVIDLIRAPTAQRSEDARALRGVLQELTTQRTYDQRIKLCLGLVLAEDGDRDSAQRVLDLALDNRHPMFRRVAELLAGS